MQVCYCQTDGAGAGMKAFLRRAVAKANQRYLAAYACVALASAIFLSDRFVQSVSNTASSQAAPPDSGASAVRALISTIQQEETAVHADVKPALKVKPLAWVCTPLGFVAGWH